MFKAITCMSKEQHWRLISSLFLTIIQHLNFISNPKAFLSPENTPLKDTFKLIDRYGSNSWQDAGVTVQVKKSCALLARNYDMYNWVHFATVSTLMPYNYVKICERVTHTVNIIVSTCNILPQLDLCLFLFLLLPLSTSVVETCSRSWKPNPIKWFARPVHQSGPARPTSLKRLSASQLTCRKLMASRVRL